MTLYGIVQDAIIGAVVLASAWYVLRKLLPNWIRGRQLALATRLAHPSRSLVLRRIGGWMAPGTSSGGGCGSGCSSCGSCASNSETQSKVQSGTQLEVKPLEFQRHI